MLTDEQADEVAKNLGFLEIGTGAQSRVSVETLGLAQHGCAELQIERLPRAALPYAKQILRELAFYVLARREVTDGQTVELAKSDLGMSLYLRAVTGKALAGGGWKPWVRKPLRLIDPEPGASPRNAPALALATSALVSARELARAGRRQEAIAVCELSIELSPGTAQSEADAPRHNTGNSRTYQFLWQLTDEPRHLEAAFSRSPLLQLDLLGMPLVGLKQLPSASALSALALQHVERTLGMHDRFGSHEVQAGAYKVFCPLARGDIDRQHRIAFCIVPPTYLQSFYEGPARRALEQATAAELAADTLAKHAAEPSRLLTMTDASRVDWLISRRNETEKSTGVAYIGPEYLLSALLAEVARCAAAGCSEDETSAFLELESNAAALATALQKRQTFADELDAALDQTIEGALH